MCPRIQYYAIDVRYDNMIGYAESNNTLAIFQIITDKISLEDNK
jgi:hypothetical protein